MFLCIYCPSWSNWHSQRYFVFRDYFSFKNPVLAFTQELLLNFIHNWFLLLPLSSDDTVSPIWVTFLHFYFPIILPFPDIFSSLLDLPYRLIGFVTLWLHRFCDFFFFLQCLGRPVFFLWFNSYLPIPQNHSPEVSSCLNQEWRNTSWDLPYLRKLP